MLITRVKKKKERKKEEEDSKGIHIRHCKPQLNRTVYGKKTTVIPKLVPVRKLNRRGEKKEREKNLKKLRK